MGSVTTGTLYKVHVFAFLAHLVQGITVAGLVSTQDLPSANWPILNLGYNRIAREGRYQLAALLPVFPLMSATNHFAVTVAPGWYENTVLKDKVNYLRFFEYTFSAGVMLWLIGTLSGLIETRTLVTLILLNSALQYTGILLETAVATDGPGSDSVKNLLTLGFMLHVAIWVPIWISFGTIIETGTPKPPAEVYAVVVILFVLFTSFGLVAALYALGFVKDYAVNELNYLILSLVSKSFLTWMLYGGVFTSRTNDDFTENVRT